jgi:hypothetical protein|nr:hypothetical protein [Kofleriaceae bacterium]
MRVAAGAASAVIALTVYARVARAEPLVLGRGDVAAQVVVEADLATFAKPLSIAPDAWVGVTDALTIGWVDSDAALDLVNDGANACFARDAPFGCPPHVSGIDARYLVLDWLAPRVRVLAKGLSPFEPAITIGALARLLRRGRVELTADPYVQLGLANTDRGNASSIVLPLFATVTVVPRVSVTGETGYVSDVSVWSDGYHIPLSATVDAKLAPHVEAALEAGFTSLVGPQNNVKQREAWLVLRVTSF